jgi:hypothetical protein
LDRAQPGDAVLVKASRAARLERVVEALLAGLAGAGANGAERRLREKGVSCSTV